MTSPNQTEMQCRLLLHPSKVVPVPVPVPLSVPGLFGSKFPALYGSSVLYGS